MSGWLRYLELTAKSRTGLSSSVLVWGLIAALCAAVTLGFFIFAAFLGLAERYGPLTAALLLGGFFLLVTIIALISCLLSQRRTIERAKLALAARSNAPWLDPKYLGIGLQIGRAIGWRKVASLAVVAVLAAGLAKEWVGYDKSGGEASTDDDQGRDEGES